MKDFITRLVIPILCICIVWVITMKIFVNNSERTQEKNGYLNFQNSEKEKVGQIWADKSILMMYGYNNRSIEIGAGDNIIINAGGGSVEIRQGNDTKIKISEDRIDIYTDLYINGKKYD